jgi:hypothetical protein
LADRSFAAASKMESGWAEAQKTKKNRTRARMKILQAH